jgi:hypothetical protein
MALLITGCEKNYSLSESQKIVFQQEYVNYAWGYQHHGIIIDNEGNVLTYDNPENWNFPDNNKILSVEQANENISSCTITGRKIPKAELQKYINYIDNISASKVSAPKSAGADMGSMVSYCYRLSEDTQTYKAYIIKMEGDIECENLNFYSRRVADWLKDILDNTSR